MLTILIIIASFIGVACLVGGVASLVLRGNGGTAVEDRLDVLTGIAGPAKVKTDEPTLLHTPLNDVPNFMEEFVKRFFNLRAFLQQADTKFTAGKFICLSIGLGLGTTVILPILRVPLAAAPLGVIVGFIPFMALYMKRKRRLANFGKQLPEALELIGRALRAGHSLDPARRRH
jgi:tight adherence protein B